MQQDEIATSLCFSQRRLDCANPRCGFARIRCLDCRTEHLLTFSCKPGVGGEIALLAAYGVLCPQPRAGQDLGGGRTGRKIHDPDASGVGAAVLSGVRGQGRLSLRSGQHLLGDEGEGNNCARRPAVSSSAKRKLLSPNRRGNQVLASKTCS